MQAVETEESLLAEIDAVIKQTLKSRAEFIQEALREAVRRQQADDSKIQKFVKSCQQYPHETEDFQIWEDEQVWEDK